MLSTRKFPVEQTEQAVLTDAVQTLQRGSQAEQVVPPSRKYPVEQLQVPLERPAFAIHPEQLPFEPVVQAVQRAWHV